jgi:hypothetical protein
MMLVSESSTTSIVLTSDRMFLVLGHPMIVEMISYRGNGRDQSARGMGGPGRPCNRRDTSGKALDGEKGEVQTGPIARRVRRVLIASSSALARSRVPTQPHDILLYQNLL